MAPSNPFRLDPFVWPQKLQKAATVARNLLRDGRNLRGISNEVVFSPKANPEKRRLRFMPMFENNYMFKIHINIYINISILYVYMNI